jgi:hypothetical protein
MNGIGKSLDRLSKQFENYSNDSIRIISTRTLIPRTSPAKDYNAELLARESAGWLSFRATVGFHYVRMIEGNKYAGQAVNHQYLAQSDTNQFWALLDQADGWVADNLGILFELLFKDQVGKLSVQQIPKWVDVVYRVAELAGSLQCKATDWKFSPMGNETSVSESYWANCVANNPFFKIPFEGEDPFLKAGKTPDEWIATRDTIIQDSLFVIDWLTENWPTTPEDNKKPEGKKRGRKPKTLSKEEKKHLELWESGNYGCFFQVDRQLKATRGTTARIVENVRKRNQRKNADAKGTK